MKEKRPGIIQVVAPLYHEDRDMIDIFLEKTSNDRVRICDHGMTLMHLSYSFDLNAENKRKIFNIFHRKREFIIERKSLKNDKERKIYNSR